MTLVIHRFDGALKTFITIQVDLDMEQASFANVLHLCENFYYCVSDVNLLDLNFRTFQKIGRLTTNIPTSSDTITRCTETFLTF